MQKWNGSLLRKFDDTIDGNVSVGTTVVVRNTIGGTLAVVYDEDDTNSVQKNNPFVTDDFGRYSFFAPNGKYTIEFGDGSDSIDIALYDGNDANDYDGFTAALLAEAGIVDNGLPDTVGNSKRVDAIELLNKNADKVLNSDGGTAQDVFDSIVVAESFGTLRDTATLQAAVDFAVSNGFKEITVADDWNVGEITNKGQVSFVGNGTVVGLYRKRVAKLTDPVNASFNDINPEVNLKRFLGKTNPIVVVVGDSISTEFGANVPYSDTLYSRICNKLAESYPTKNITFYNRSIGGETYFAAVGLPSNFPIWYTDTGRGWVRYVGDLNPDLVIFNFGMNDSSNLHTNKLEEYQGYFDSTGVFPAGRPDVIYCTNLTPSIDTTFASLGSQVSQQGRDHVAGFTRTYAKAKGAGLLDFHRQCTIVKDGYDPTDTYLERVGAITPVSGAVGATDYPCTDFKWELTLPLGIGENMAIRLGSPADTAIDPARRGSYAVVYNNAGNFKVDFFTSDITNPANIYANIDTSIAIPSGNFVLTVDKKQESVIFLVNGNFAARFDKLRVAGADVPPRAGDATYTSGPIVSANFWVGRYKTYKQSVVNDDMWGESDNQAIQRQPFGGNGVNHPSSIGSADVFQPVLDMSNFSGIGEIRSALTLMNGWRNVPGKLASSAHKRGSLVTINFAVRVPTDGVAASGIVLNVPVDFRPPAGISAYALIQTSNAAGNQLQCDLSTNGDITIYGNVDAFAWGTIIFSI